jgi:hypothetical protein
MNESLFRLFASSYSQFHLTKIHNESVILHRLCTESLDANILRACIFMKKRRVNEFLKIN